MGGASGRAGLCVFFVASDAIDEIISGTKLPVRDSKKKLSKKMRKMVLNIYKVWQRKRRFVIS